jgi:hypothetical protein
MLEKIHFMVETIVFMLEKIHFIIDDDRIHVGEDPFYD